jgi:methyl-accepting chemotaxis protein
MTPAEAMQSHLAELSEDLAKSVEAQVEQAKATEQIAEGVLELRHKFGELSDKVEEMIALFGNYARDTAALRSEVREKLKAVNGQR